MQNLSSDLQQRALGIKLLILDVDGVFDRRPHFYPRQRRRNQIVPHFGRTRFEMLQASGVQTAIITGRDAPSVGIRVKQLGINYYFKGIHDKRAAYAQLREQAGVEEHECAFVGDDVVDLPVMVRCGLAVAVPEAHWFTLQYAHYVTRRSGGAGAVREVCDLIMQAQGTLEPALKEYVR